MARINISIPDDLKEKIEAYNKQNPYTKINVSRVAQDAINKTIIEMTT